MEKLGNSKAQLAFDFYDDKEKIKMKFGCNNENSERKVQILFRNTIPEIPLTTSGTFSIYKYPAKFIPQVIAYVLKEYAKPGMKIFDPFAGSGTVGIVSRVYGYDYILWDLNPMIEVIHNTAVIKKIETNPSSIIREIKNSDKEFIPNWSNIEYWFPSEFLSVLTKAWGVANSLTETDKYLLLIPLLKVSRFFSYSDEKVHKLYKSKHSKKGRRAAESRLEIKILFNVGKRDVCAS